MPSKDLTPSCICLAMAEDARVPLHDDTLEALARTLQRQAQATGHRATLLLSGDADWTATHAWRCVAALPDQVPTWLTERPLADGALPLRAADRLLGSDLDLLVYDAHRGFDPDGFGAATGAIRGGGLLLLLTPHLEAWPDLTDPQAERIAVWPNTAASVGGRFLRRLARLLGSEPGLIHLAQADAVSLSTAQRVVSDAARNMPESSDPGRTAAENDPDLTEPATSDQDHAIAAILAVAHGRARRPLVIRAHRGRGKSAALGLAAGKLLGERPLRILVTAPRRSATDALFKHAAAVLAGDAQTRAPDAESGSRTDKTTAAAANRSGYGEAPGSLEFVSPADLAAQTPAADLLLIDEAAGIPAPMLETLLARYPRVVFATTVHGYEGTGRGFDVRFRDTLDRLTPNWREIALDTPIRWADGDPLEALTFRALLLDAAPATAEVLSDADAAEIRCERLDRDALGQDEKTLRELFGLLVLAHYQTRPMDLRMLLDGPNVRVYVLRWRDHVVATLLAAEEGSFTDPDLREAIFTGRRRPRGHLLPQTLSTHAGLAEAPALRYLRVIRIAVHPALARCGLGRRLLRRLAHDARAEGVDLLGASFGATPELIRFWDRCGFRPAQMGTSRNAASGEHALVVLRRLGTRGWRFAAEAEARLEARLPVLLAGPLRTLDPVTVVALVAALRAEPEPEPPSAACRDAIDDHELSGFIDGHRSLDATLPLLADLTRRRLGPCLRAARIAIEDAALLIAATRQLQGPAALASRFGASGHDAILTRIRHAAEMLRSDLLETVPRVTVMQDAAPLSLPYKPAMRERAE
ncbi:tRNA(Met) cytidine acetyltransferase TmcA [Thiocapsa rosea]|uniref:tRNA(Met) cytidine acetyltransferase TmcA n=1 Tax=Thiocapsa rosea TaxID=69360 RepID=A0A495VG39_9GAMM|nr:GNAT family N-acetyltransferase [Thiocapsa rosea]RKT46798.1 tRNA(Met)-cytidine N(4)-acetyltransferase [Thiocapsa rosea]